MAIGLDLGEPGAYAAHALHDDERTWPETNCYVDLWITLLHAHGLDPMGGLAFTVDLDFEGDQYTFFKFSHDELFSLYGIEVQELNVWRPLVVHAAEQLSLGRIFMPEVDSFYLPDTAGVGYHLEHGKSTIGIVGIDPSARTLSYFHNRGLHTLDGADFAGIFRLDEHAAAPGVLAPYAEIAKLDGIVRRPIDQLASQSHAMLGARVARRPRSNPVARHRARITTDLEWLRGEPIETFHQYAFATVRQAGACYGLTASYLRWLAAVTAKAELEPAAVAFERISVTAKTLQFKLARMASLRREVDIAPLLETMERSWDEGMGHLVEHFGG